MPTLRAEILNNAVGIELEESHSLAIVELMNHAGVKTLKGLLKYQRSMKATMKQIKRIR